MSQHVENPAFQHPQDSSVLSLGPYPKSSSNGSILQKVNPGSGGVAHDDSMPMFLDEAKLAARHLRLASSTEQEEDDEEYIQDPTVNENTGRWTREEHHMFLKGLEMHGKGWKKIAAFIKTRTVVQIRTHAQKYFLKLQKARQGNESNGLLIEDRSLFGRKSRKRRCGDKLLALNK